MKFICTYLHENQPMFCWPSPSECGTTILQEAEKRYRDFGIQAEAPLITDRRSTYLRCTESQYPRVIEYGNRWTVHANSPCSCWKILGDQMTSMLLSLYSSFRLWKLEFTLVPSRRQWCPLKVGLCSRHRRKTMGRRRMHPGMSWQWKSWDKKRKRRRRLRIPKRTRAAEDEWKQLKTDQMPLNMHLLVLCWLCFFFIIYIYIYPCCVLSRAYHLSQTKKFILIMLFGDVWIWCSVGVLQPLTQKGLAPFLRRWWISREVVLRTSHRSTSWRRKQLPLPWRSSTTFLTTTGTASYSIPLKI